MGFCVELCPEISSCAPIPRSDWDGSQFARGVGVQNADSPCVDFFLNTQRPFVWAGPSFAATLIERFYNEATF